MHYAAKWEILSDFVVEDELDAGVVEYVCEYTPSLQGCNLSGLQYSEPSIHIFNLPSHILCSIIIFTHVEL